MKKLSGMRRPVAQMLTAGIVVATAVGLAFSRTSVFRQADVAPDASVWRLILADEVTVGFLRLGTVVACLYGIASVAALIVGGRWMKGFGARGFEADDPDQLQDRLASLEERLREANDERDLALLLLREHLDG